MQETEFIRQNKDKWNEFENVLLSGNKDPERVTELFIETTDDLSYSRTYYNNRSVRVYLNGIAQQVYQVIYRNKKREKNAFMNFWRQELPAALWYERKSIYFSFALFMLGLGIGLLSSMYYPEFARIIMGEQYIEMTKQNIANGDPMAVYKDMDALPMFFRIVYNNILVSFFCFIAGLLFGVGTVYFILSNAIMVGAFIYFFIERGLFRESFLAIMLHGTLELSMIVVAGAAGFTLARGLIFPGTYTRGQSLILASRSAVKIMIGVSVLLVYAAFIESFLTRHTDMGDSLRALIIFLSAVLVVGYFVIYPIYRHRKGYIPPPPLQEIPKRKPVVYVLDIIKPVGRNFTETWDLFAANARMQALVALVIGLVFMVGYYFMTQGNMHVLFDYFGISGPVGIIYPWASWNNHLNFDEFPLAYGLVALAMAGYSIVFFYAADKKFGRPTRVDFVDVINAIFVSGIAMLPLLLPQYLTFFILPFWLPLCLLLMYVCQTERRFFITAMGRPFELMAGNYWKMMGAYLSTFIMQWIVFFVLSSQVLDLVVQMVTMNIPRNAPLAEQAYYLIATFLLFFIPALVFSLSLYSVALYYHSARELVEANSLLASIKKIGFKKRAYGMEKEA